MILLKDMVWMYSLEIKPEADKIFKKLAKKDIKQLSIINKKILEIRKSPLGYKFLRKPLQNFNRVHIGSFVLIFRIDHNKKLVEVFYFGHHDNVYQWKP
jgi:YafQ family addiction module toxin component